MSVKALMPRPARPDRRWPVQRRRRKRRASFTCGSYRLGKKRNFRDWIGRL